MSIRMDRQWAMPNANTFSIPPIKKFIQRNMNGGLWLDPFSRHSPFARDCVTNDLDPESGADYCLEALEFLRRFDTGSVDGVLFDPPYSPRQIAECYRHVGRAVHQSDTQASFYGDRKKEVARVVKPGGVVMTFGWSSGGIGKSRGFDIREVLLVPHGGAHNDTICVAEVKR